MSTLEVLAGSVPAERYGIRIASAFPGDGTRDAFEFEMVTRTGGRYRHAPEMASPEAPRGPEGRPPHEPAGRAGVRRHHAAHRPSTHA